MELETRELILTEIDKLGVKGKKRHYNIIEKMVLDLTTYPILSPENICFTKESGSKLGLDIIAGTAMEKKDIFELLGIMGDSEAIWPFLEGIPIKMTLELDMNYFKDVVEKNITELGGVGKVRKIIKKEDIE